MRRPLIHRALAFLLLRLDTKLGEFVDVAKPGDGPAARAHPGTRFNEAIFQGPEFSFFRDEINHARAADFALDQFIMPTDRTNLACFIEVFRAVEHASRMEHHLVFFGLSMFSIKLPSETAWQNSK
jgi:hypothetical protein